MATNLSVTHLWGALPENYQASTPDDFVQQLAKILTSYVAGTYTTINFGSSTPAAEDQDKPWFRTTATGEFDRIYSYSSVHGKWVSPHPAPYSGNERRIWVGSASNLLSYDGGDGTSGTPTATTGAMWEIDTAFAAKFPVGAGTFTTAGTVAVTDSATDSSVEGADQHTFTDAELPAHNHFVVSSTVADNTSTIPPLATNDSISEKIDEGAGIDSPLEYALTGRDRATYPADVAKTSDTGDGDPFYVLPPFYGVHFIRRTDREFYTVS